MYGHVTKLVCHREAVVVVEAAYNDDANAVQCSMLTQEFYGPQYVLFKNKSGAGRYGGHIVSSSRQEKTDQHHETSSTTTAGQVRHLSSSSSSSSSAAAAAFNFALCLIVLCAHS